MSDPKKHNEEEPEFINPIDPDKITENPHNLPYAHHAGSALVKPEDTGKIKGRAMAAMVQQTEKQLGQLYDQMKVLAEQANAIKQRVEVSEKIYQANIGYEPIVGNEYYLYEKDGQKYILSMIGPHEWGKKCPFNSFISKVRLLADHTWELLEHDATI